MCLQVFFLLFTLDSKEIFLLYNHLEFVPKRLIPGGNNSIVRFFAELLKKSLSLCCALMIIVLCERTILNYVYFPHLGASLSVFLTGSVTNFIKLGVGRFVMSYMYSGRPIYLCWYSRFYWTSVYQMHRLFNLMIQSSIW